jgi:cation:H+ antiporter
LKGTILLSSLSLPILILIFLGAAAFVWIAGIKLSNTTDVLSERLGLGQALGGLIILTIATNLPETAITASASLNQNLGVATGNILGGIAIQTVVLVVLDVFGVRGREPLSYRGASLMLVLEGVLLMAILTTTVMGTQLPTSLIFWRLSPASLLIALLWVVGLWLISKARRDLPWHEQGNPPGGQEKAQGSSKTHKSQEDSQDKGVSTTRTVIVFAVAAVVTLAGGVVLEESGNSIAGDIGMNGVLFGSTFLAASTALPEVSTGLASVKLGDYKLAFSDIFGGNAFLPVLFVLASLLSGVAPLPQAQKSDIYLTGLGALLTAIYLYGLIFRPRLRVLRMGIDSLVVLVLYVVGIVGLIAVVHG